ncbi:metallophosphoesterase [Clostridioides sp. ES-S-0006-03]|uniref:bifunctional metallophosphatase/5'-nucleotidase n=1 Tax=Clostridioides sp. ES-S-0006-03 TaxID=2770775 RepID=UPI001D0C9FC5|nr:metallophosphoesterase [Clostridioides sp. ES-S-0006-03]
MKNKIIIGITFLSILLMYGCTSKQTTEINVLATTDLHGNLPYELTSYIKEEREKDKNITLVDAGDFFDSGPIGSTMEKYFDDRRTDIDNKTEKYVEAPIAKEMKEIGYDSVVLGNHEFVSNSKFYLDNMISDFNKQDINVLSANTYKKDGSSYTKPYIIKNINTPKGNVKLGILGLTIKEVGENVDSNSLELKDQGGYNGELYMNDLVDGAKKWVDVMKKDKVDIIVSVVHSGEKPKKPKNPGNRIQDLAQNVDGIDAIVAGHTHVQIKQHDYKNNLGEKVIVTQPGKHGECVSKINFKLEKNNDKWNVVDKSSELSTFEKNQEMDRVGEFFGSIFSLDGKTKEISLGKVLPFKWDKLYVFKPYTPVETIYKTVGYKWRNIIPTDSEDMVQMVFMSNKKPICYIYGDSNKTGLSLKIDKSEYKDSIITVLPNDNDNFKVQKDEKTFKVNLEHIKKNI